MKRLACEMCGSNDLVKQDGVFVCQNCGTKYSVEEAKKLMIEGPVEVEGKVEVTGTVKIDSEDKLQKLYQIARRAKEEDNAENAANYYEKVLEYDPNSWEASFYVVYFKAKQQKVMNIKMAAKSVTNCLDSVLKLLKQQVENELDLGQAIKEISDKCNILCDLLITASRSNFYENNLKTHCTNVEASRDILYELGNLIDSNFDLGVFSEESVSLWKKGIEIHNSILPYFSEKNSNQYVIEIYAKKIGKYDEEYYKKYSNSQNIVSLTKERENLKNKKESLVKQRNNLNEKITSLEEDVRSGTFVVRIIAGICMLIVGFIFASLGYPGLNFFGVSVLCIGIGVISYAISKMVKRKQLNEEISSENVKLEKLDADIKQIKSRIKEVEDSIKDYKINQYISSKIG